MKVGNKIFKLFFLVIFLSFSSKAEERISSSPLINLDSIKPSFEDQESSDAEIITKKNLKIKERSKDQNMFQVKLIGLDKITAKSSEISLNLNETTKFGPLEIKILKCGKIENNNKTDDVAYMQVKDLTKNENEKVFIFNGWTFASDPNLTPFDHAIYDLQLLNCYKV